MDTDDEALRGRIADAKRFFPDVASLGGETEFTTEDIERAIDLALPDRQAAFWGNCARFAVALNDAVGGPGHYVCASAPEFGANHVAVVLGGRMFDGSGFLSVEDMVERYIEVERDLEPGDGDAAPTFEEWARLRLCEFVAVCDPEGREVRLWGDTGDMPYAFDVAQMTDALRSALAGSSLPLVP